MASRLVGRCCLGAKCFNPTHQLNPQHMCLHCDKIVHVDKCGQFLDPENSEDILCKLCIEKERPLAGCYAKASDKVAENDDTDSSIEPYFAAISRKPRANDEMAMDVDSIQPEDIIIEPEDSIAPIPRKPHAKRSSSGSRSSSSRKKTQRIGKKFRAKTTRAQLFHACQPPNEVWQQPQFLWFCCWRKHQRRLRCEIRSASVQ